MLGGQSDLKGPYGHVIKISINLIKHLSVPVRVCFQGLTFSHGHRQDRILGSRNPATRNKTRPKCSGELLKGANRTWTQTIKPPHSHRPQGWWKYLAHQGLILGVYNHSLVEVTYVFHRICTAVVHGERGLNEPPRKSPFLNPACERRSGNLFECSAHRIIPQAFRRWASVSMLKMVVLIVRERLTKRSLWCWPITTVLLIVKREIRNKGSSPSPFVAQLPFLNDQSPVTWLWYFSPERGGYHP